MNTHPPLVPEPDPDLDLEAYHDDELDDAGRSRVEAALAASPTLRASLADLSGLRELLAGLPRAEPRDIAPEVLAGLDRERSLRRTRARLAASSAVAAGLALAASLLIAWNLRGRASRDVPGPGIAHVTEARPRPLPTPEPLPPPPPRPGRPVPTILPAAEAVSPRLLAEEQRRRSDRQRLDAILARGEMHQISLVVDDLGPATLEALDETIRLTPRREPEHAVIRLVQDVVPGEGGARDVVVYALCMDPYESGRFRDRLKIRLPLARVETDAEGPGTVATLAASERIEIRRGEPRSTLVPPPFPAAPDVAIRRDPLEGQPEGGPPGLARPREPRPGPGPPRRPAPTIAVYLVWVRAAAPAEGGS